MKVKNLIKQVSSTQTTVYSKHKKDIETKEVDFKVNSENIQDSKEITVDKYGHKWKFGLNLGRAELGEYFTKEQIEEWTTSFENVDALYSAFLNFVSDAQARENYTGGLSMNYYDFCYLLEQGEIVNEQNVGFTEEIIKDRNWDFSVMLTETFGVRNVEQNKQQLDIMRAVMDLGMVSKDKGLMSPEDVRELLAKKKYKEQQLVLERAFEKKHLLQKQLESNE